MFGKQLGRAKGAGEPEPLKHEEPVVRVWRGQLLFWCRNPDSLGGWTWRTVHSLPKSRGGPEMPVCGQLAPASLSKSIFLTASTDDPSHGGWRSALLVGSWARLGSQWRTPSLL